MVESVTDLFVTGRAVPSAFFTVSMTEEDMVASEKRFLRFNPSRLFFAEISIFQNCFISLQRP
jgi:hypothetical protein